jgi:hypothetical protein
MLFNNNDHPYEMPYLESFHSTMRAIIDARHTHIAIRTLKIISFLNTTSTIQS